MTTNNENLELIYKRTSVLEMVEKLKNCGVIWLQISPNTYQSTHIITPDVWDLNITKMANSGLVVVDFKKNGSYFFTINSEIDSNLLLYYDEIEGDYEFQKDKEILREVTKIPGCWEP